MMRVFGKETKGPSIHALIFGVSAYPKVPEWQLAPAEVSAQALSSFLTGRFGEPQIPHATLEVLTSTDTASPRPPTFGNLRDSTYKWLQRVNSHPDNIALFFFLGRTAIAEGNELLLLPDDFGGSPSESSGGIRLSQLMSAAAPCAARRQLFIVDAVRQILAHGLGPGPFMAPTHSHAPASQSSIVGLANREDYAHPRGPSRLAHAWIETLRAPLGSPGAAVRVLDIARSVTARMATQGARFKPEIKIGLDFELQFARAPAEQTVGNRKSAAATETSAARSTRKAPASARTTKSGGKLPGIKAQAKAKPERAQQTKRQQSQVPEESQDGTPPEQSPSEPSDPFQGAIADRETDDGRPAAAEKPDKASVRRSKERATGDDTAATTERKQGRQRQDPVEHTPQPMTRTELHAKETEALSALDGAGESANERPQEDTEFVLDDAEAERDWLGRAVLAVGLARRLHRIWRKTNEAGGGEPGARGAFVVHLDAPWGGGKTTFANFLARFLNPDPRPSSVVRELYPIGDVSGLFLDEPPADPAAATALAKLPEQVRRPWIVVPFNAWQAEHCEPPWWVFYQAIRKGCFDAIWSEGDLAVRPRAPSNRRWRSWGLGLLAWLARPVWPEGLFSVGRPAWPGSPPGLDWPGRAWRWVSRQLAGKVGWVGLVIGEYAWRLFNPKILSLLATALISGGLVYALDRYGLFNVANGGVGFNLDSALGLMFAALTGITAIWGLGAVVTDSIVPGTGSLAERLSLGSGDPFARFRRHFARTMEAVQRPVMVVVDDLDRCRPAFVVDLIRGMQTLLRSPRVVFVILGDRDWIERAFEEHHQAMKAVDVGPEQTFGARFVEKAIQMSFILPALDEDPKLQYVRRVLLGDRAGAPVAPSSDSPPADDEAAAPANSRQEHVAKVAAAKVRQLTHSAASVAGVSVFDTAGIVDMVFDAIDRIEPSKETPVDVRESLKQLNRDQVGQYAGEALAVHTASSGEAERAIVHELQGFAPLFPANPRQIKRIVNAVTVYYSVARERLKENADAAFRAQLTLWIIVMTEWPQTWRLLASCPRLAEVIVADDWEKQLESLGAASPQLLPGSLAATKKEVERVRADSELLALLRGGQRTGARPLEAASVETLAKLTPLHSRKRRLDEPADDPETPEHPARKKRQPRT